MNSTEPIIETWFPKTLYICNGLHMEQLSVYKKEILRLIKNKSIRTETKYVDTTHGVIENNLVNNIIFDELKQTILFHSSQYLEILGYDVPINIQNMWANLSKKGDYLFPHNHPNSLLSGAFYVSVTNKKDVIKFYNNINDMSLPITEDKFNEFNFQTCTHQCVAGKLIIFKSDFLHGCPALQGDEKIVISFNITTQR